MMRLATALAIVLIASALATATTITVVNVDGAGEGFNDPTPTAPVGGNAGTTLGAQRLNAFTAAADVWAGILSSTVEIRINANMDPLSCSSSSAVLGSAGPESYFKNFTGALLTDTYYPQALANKLAGVDVDPGTDDIGATFNSAIGTTCSFPMVWYYGLDASPPSGEIDFISVVLHELGHGLGFAPTVVPTGPDQGKKFFGVEDADDAYIVHLEDHSTTKPWPIMTNAERATSITDTGDLHWTGPAVVAAAGFLTAGRDPVSGHVEMYAPSPVEPGSAIAHFSTTLAPDQLLEPFYTGPNHAPALTAQVMVDMGWMLSCGDGVVDTGEGCDDGDSTPGDGCSALCQVEACWSCSGAPSTCSTLPDGSGCSDGNACTQTDSCSSGTCAGSNPVTCTALDQCHAVGVCD
ncbi:MAG: hypothetical protein ACREQL_13650, partial [Candidatus Binatia bacterium]